MSDARQESKYRSPREIATDIVGGDIKEATVRAKLKKAIIQAIIERDQFWKRQIARIHQ